jgi:hypothetical protein
MRRQNTARLAPLTTHGRFVLLFAPLPWLAAATFPDYPVRPAGEYALTAQKAGFIVGIQPVEDPVDQKTYFNAELGASSIIPVFVVVENRSSADSLLFDKTGIRYAQTEVGALSTPDVHSKAGEEIFRSAQFFGNAIGGVIGGTMISKAANIQQNIVKKEIQSKTLSLGTSVHGFLYVTVPTAGRQKKRVSAPTAGPRSRIHLQIPLTTAGGETFVFDLVF